MMSLTIHVNGSSLIENKTQDVTVLSRKKPEKQQGKTSFFAGETNIFQDSVAQKRKEAQEKALKVVQDAWKSDQAVDDSIQLRKTHYAEMESRKKEAQEQLAGLNEDARALQEMYGVSDDSKEQQDLELLKKRQDFQNGVTHTPLSKDEMERLKEIDQKPLTEYQSRALKLNDQAGRFKKEIADSVRQMADDTRDIRAIELERLKTHPMVDAQKAADTIMDAANDEMIGMLVQEATDHIDEKMEEEGGKAEEKAKEKEEEEEKLENIREERALQEAVVEGTKEAYERAEARQRRDETPDIELTDMLQITKSSGQANDVQKSLDDIKNSMNLLEADLKGIKVDEQI